MGGEEIMMDSNYLYILITLIAYEIGLVIKKKTGINTTTVFNVEPILERTTSSVP